MTSARSDMMRESTQTWPCARHDFADESRAFIAFFQREQLENNVAAYPFCFLYLFERAE